MSRYTLICPDMYGIELLYVCNKLCVPQSRHLPYKRMMGCTIIMYTPPQYVLLTTPQPTHPSTHPNALI